MLHELSAAMHFLQRVGAAQYRDWRQPLAPITLKRRTIARCDRLGRDPGQQFGAD
jgi:hypothetical protein